MIQSIINWFRRSRHVKLLRISINELHRQAQVLEKAMRKVDQQMSGTSCAAFVSDKVLKGDMFMATDLTDEIAKIQEVKDVVESAIVLVRSIPTLIAKAKSDAIENGATAEQLQPLEDLVLALRASADDLANAVVENTPAADDPVDDPADDDE